MIMSDLLCLGPGMVGESRAMVGGLVAQIATQKRHGDYTFQMDWKRYIITLAKFLPSSLHPEMSDSAAMKACRTQMFSTLNG